MVMQDPHRRPIEARVLFIRAYGVLYASNGSPEMTRRYVWAPLLESLLQPYPEVCVVYLRAQGEADDIDALKASLGRLGQRLIDVLPADHASLEASVRHWRRHHPEVAHVRLLAAGEGAERGAEWIACSPAQGIRAQAVQSALRDWLAGDTNHVETPMITHDIIVMENRSPCPRSATLTNGRLA